LNILFETQVGAIYDLNVGIAANGDVKPDFNAIRFGVPLKSEIYARRIPMSSVPSDEKGISDFVQKLYQEKVTLNSLVVVLLLLCLFFFELIIKKKRMQFMTSTLVTNPMLNLKETKLK
jgi:hypothetical protein